MDEEKTFGRVVYFKVKKVICLKSREPNLDEMVDRYIHAEFLRVVDISGYDFNNLDNSYYLTLLVEEKMVDIKQGFTGFVSTRLENLVKDINDYCEVMQNSDKISFDIQLVRTYRVRQPDGRMLWVAYMVYHE